ncbi:hypothetical protein Tco_1438560 [Tanacetum coccineum]
MVLMVQVQQKLSYIEQYELEREKEQKLEEEEELMRLRETLASPYHDRHHRSNYRVTRTESSHSRVQSSCSLRHLNILQILNISRLEWMVFAKGIDADNVCMLPEQIDGDYKLQDFKKDVKRVGNKGKGCHTPRRGLDGTRVRRRDFVEHLKYKA